MAAADPRRQASPGPVLLHGALITSCIQMDAGCRSCTMARSCPLSLWQEGLRDCIVAAFGERDQVQAGVRIKEKREPRGLACMRR